MNDLIRRKDAIEAMYQLEAEDIERYGCSIPEGFDAKPAVEALKTLPSVDTERTAKVTLLTPNSKSYWSTNGRCQGCGFLLERKHAYCPNCGAKLDWSKK